MVLFPANVDKFRPPTFRLENSPFHPVRETEYLGVTIAVEGISPTKSLQRVETARARLYSLATFGLNGKEFSPYWCLNLYLMLVHPIYEYMAFLAGTFHALQKAFKNLEGDFFIFMFGAYARTKQARLRKLCRLESFDTRSEYLGLQYMARMLQTREDLLK